MAGIIQWVSRKCLHQQLPPLFFSSAPCPTVRDEAFCTFNFSFFFFFLFFQTKHRWTNIFNTNFGDCFVVGSWFSYFDTCTAGILSESNGVLACLHYVCTEGARKDRVIFVEN